MMKGVLVPCLLPRSLVDQFEKVIGEGGQKPTRAFQAAVAGFLKMSPEERAAAMKAIEHFGIQPPVKVGRGRKDPALGLAVQLKVKHPDRMIG